MRSRKVDVDRVFEALGDRKRRLIIERLTKGPVSVSQLAAPLGITVTAVAQHLQILETSRLVHTEKLGRVRTCRLEPAGFAAIQKWVGDRQSAWEKRLDRLGDFLDESE